MKLTVVAVGSVTCPSCPAKAGEPCVVTVAPEVGPLSITWHHTSRERASLE